MQQSATIRQVACALLCNESCSHDCFQYVWAHCQMLYCWPTTRPMKWPNMQSTICIYSIGFGQCRSNCEAHINATLKKYYKLSHIDDETFSPILRMIPPCNTVQLGSFLTDDLLDQHEWITITKRFSWLWVICLNMHLISTKIYVPRDPICQSGWCKHHVWCCYIVHSILLARPFLSCLWQIV